ncbi:bL21 family ribosomal protein, partial [Rhodococcus sp. (in: high G+C Gram-positive bacteria)]|uniref:bL21 family ribosomal protein n=1 Tax=Rhodococcus sp. TaxID=1831 RepID=UPI00257E28B9
MPRVRECPDASASSRGDINQTSRDAFDASGGSASKFEEARGSPPMATYAIVKTGGKQYKVAVGDLVKVEKI